MKITTVNHEDRYSLEQIACLFLERDSEALITSELTEDNFIKTEIKLENMVCEASYKADCKDVRSFKNSVKKSAYLAMKKLKGSDIPWGTLTGIRPTKFCRELGDKYSYEEIRNILTEDYWVSDKKADFCLEVTKNSQKLINRIKPEEIGVYIGVPFCPSRCSYCSFVSESSALYKKYIPEYTEALKKEILSTAEFSRKYGLKPISLYIGGGTPPTLGTKGLAEVIDTALNGFSINPSDVEFTVEAGRPDIIDEELLSVLSAKGVNRLCINPQTMNDKTLKLIGRNHNTAQTEKAFSLARSFGFGNINSDLIAGLPEEGIEEFSYSLERIGELSPEGITVHTMYLKRTAEITKEKKWDSCGKDIEEMLDFAYDYTKNNGYAPYYMYKQRSTVGNQENTGYAKAGYESIYNSAIMEEVQTILACGAGASTKIAGNDIERVYNIKDAFSYIRDIDDIVVKKEEKLKSIFGKR